MDHCTSNLYGQQNSQSETKTKLIYFQDYGSCVTKQSNILPTPLKTLFNTKPNTNNTKHSIIFQCGGVAFTKNINLNTNHVLNSTRCCGAYFISHSDNTILSTQTLPFLSTGIAGNSLIYDDKYGLISIGGYYKLKKTPLPINILTWRYFNTANVYNLSFQKQCRNWSNLQKLPTKISFAASTMVDKKCILTVGGLNDNGIKTKDANIYHFDTNKWTPVGSMVKPRAKSGAFYCKKRNVMYIAGGFKTFNANKVTVECYNIDKNKWYMFPSTNTFHFKPIVWTNSHTNNILYIGSCFGNMECIDLRIGTKWNIIYSKKEKTGKKTLLNVFGVNNAFHYLSWNGLYNNCSTMLLR